MRRLARPPFAQEVLGFSNSGPIAAFPCLPWFPILLCPTAVLAAILLLIGHTAATEEAIHAEELALHEARHRALVAVHFAQTHGITLAEADWHREINGEVPAELLRTRALASAQRDRAIQRLAQAHGVGQPLPFPGFAAHLEAVNTARRQAKAQANGQPIYGRIEFTPWQLYRYEVDNLRLRLQAKFRETEPTDEAAQARVEAALRS